MLMRVLGGTDAKAISVGVASHLALAITLNGYALAQTAGGANQPPSAGNERQLPPVTIESPSRRSQRQGAQTSVRGRTARTARTQADRGAGAPPVESTAGSGRSGSESAWGPVDGYVASRSASGTKTDTPLIETPAAISVVTRDQIQGQAAQTIPQAVRYTSGVRGEPTGADNRFDYLFIRGFQADFYLDSLKLIGTSGFGFSSSVIEPYNLERIEVLHGPASVIYGQASPGGVVDMVSKRPTEQPYHEMFFTTGSYGRVQGGIDLSGPVDQNKEWLYRITASGYDVGTQVDHTEYQRVSVAPSLTWRPDKDTSITFLGSYQNDPKAGFYNLLPKQGTQVPFSNGQFISTSFYGGEPDFDKMSRERAQIGYLAEHRFDNVWTARQNLRYTDLRSDIQNVYQLGVASGTTTLERAASLESDRIRQFTVDNQAEARFAFGPFSHTMLFGLDYQTGTWNQTYSDGTVNGNNLDVFNPVYGAVSVSWDASSLIKSKQDFNQLGFYAQDQIKLDRWVALLGVRWDQADTDTHNLLSGSTTSQSDNATTKRAALLYKFDNGVSPYIQYTESFQPTLGTNTSGNPFKPTTGKQEEAGIKYQPDPKSLYTLAVFSLTQQNVLTLDPNDLSGLNRVQTGEIRSRGLELEGKTEINRSLSLLGSYTYLDQVITKSNFQFQEGHRPVGVPMHSAALWADYTFHDGALDGFGLAGGVRYLGETTGSTFFPTVDKVPAVTLFDAALHYDLAALGPQYKGFQFQLNARNLFDKTYLTFCQDNGCYYGLRREILATLRYRW